MKHAALTAVPESHAPSPGYDTALNTCSGPDNWQYISIRGHQFVHCPCDCCSTHALSKQCTPQPVLGRLTRQHAPLFAAGPARLQRWLLPTGQPQRPSLRNLLQQQRQLRQTRRHQQQLMLAGEQERQQMHTGSRLLWRAGMQGLRGMQLQLLAGVGQGCQQQCLNCLEGNHGQTLTPLLPAMPCATAAWAGACFSPGVPTNQQHQSRLMHAELVHLVAYHRQPFKTIFGA